MKLFRLIPAIAVVLALGFAGCSKDDDEPKDPDHGETPAPEGDYGKLDGNLIAVGSIKDVTYTSSVLLGTVDFPKITGDHTYGIVYMEALGVADFDYDGKLVYDGKSDKTDKVDYECTHLQITSSAADGKFEKQLVNLKPATTYYYRAYVRIGSNFNYSAVKYFTTLDPAPEITMSTAAPSDVYAVAATLNGVCNVGKLQDVNEDQEYGFIYTSAPQLSTPDKLTYEYYEEWERNHFETEDEIEEPDEVTTKSNLNGRISCVIDHLKPGTTYYYRTFFSWNGKYFYSPEVKSVQANGAGEITVGTQTVTDITGSSATLNGTVPFSLIGLPSVDGGFMISKVYSVASEFNMNTAMDWDDRDRYPYEPVYYIEDDIYDRDFSMNISGLESETTYYVVAYICLGEFDNAKGEKENLYIYSPVQRFKTEKAETGILSVTSTGLYPWINVGGTWTSGNSGQHNSDSDLYIVVKHNIGQTLSMHVSVSSESGCDILNIIADGITESTFSGEVNRDWNYTFTTAGETTFRLNFHKDGSVDRGEDHAVVSNIRLLD